MGISRKIWVAASGIVLLWAGASCAHYGGGERGLTEGLRAARQQAELERTRVLELEARLAWLEQKTRAMDQHIEAPRNEQRLIEKLDMLIALNQRLLSERAIQLAGDPTPAVADSKQHSRLATPECDVGLNTEEKIRQLVLRLRGERSPWRVDGLSYEESEALRFLLRRERQLDAKNPWQ